ncbi:MAG TPA: hypothetical protein VKV27_04880 [Solirubrobacteraceae bacterium]|nr:hypothetical protein [Solirubrobacteraceae bacterium]
MLNGLFSRHTRLTGAAIALLGAAALSGAPAHAALIDTDACDNATLTQPFARWGDPNLYKLVPGGSFEGGPAGWTLTGGAAIVPGSEPYGATGSVGRFSLGLPAGASATSPFTCVDAAYPSFRFFARDDLLLSTVAVSVVYRSPLGGELTLPVGVVALSGAWEPSLPMLTGSVATALLSGGVSEVALRFTALTGDSQIDDVFVDPRCRW